MDPNSLTRQLVEHSVSALSAHSRQLREQAAA